MGHGLCSDTYLMYSSCWATSEGWGWGKRSLSSNIWRCSCSWAAACAESCQHNTSHQHKDSRVIRTFKWLKEGLRLLFAARGPQGSYKSIIRKLLSSYLLLYFIAQFTYISSRSTQQTLENLWKCLNIQHGDIFFLWILDKPWTNALVTLSGVAHLAESCILSTHAATAGQTCRR
jgi:hypothetical protein